MGSKNNDIFSKFRRKLTQDDETSVEIREDEEQGTKLQEIIDLLVASGYFRARIKGLSSFDKVVGGMTWCIESCNVDLDVDLLFQENSTIGQKIALTEKIVAVLPKLKCPHLIEPHQIQGLDFINIFPVIQWLVKRSMEHRQEVAKSVRSYAVNQFDKDFSKPDVEQDKKVAELRKNVQTVQEIYRPRRTHRLKGAPPEDLKTRIEVTLLEYGGCASAPGTSGDSLTAESELNMTQTDFEDYSFENLTEEEKTKVRKHYNALHMELEDGGIQSEEMRKLDELEETLSFLEAQVDRLKNLKENTETELETSQKLVVALTKKQIEANEALEELQSQQNVQKVAEIEQLVIQNDTLRAKETDYKEHCKKELKRIQALIEDAKTSKTTPSTSNDLTLELEEESRKLKQLKLHLAKKNRLVSSLKRQIDEAPSRSELTQYQRRFLELYNQISAKHKETKQYYTLYNTLEDTKMYMKKELSLLNSISETYPESLLTSGGKEEFLEQFQAILNGVKQSKHKLELKLAEGKRNRATLSYLLHGLTDLQRKYVAACRELSFKCKEFEQLSQNT